MDALRIVARLAQLDTGLREDEGRGIDGDWLRAAGLSRFHVRGEVLGRSGRVLLYANWEKESSWGGLVINFAQRDRAGIVGVFEPESEADVRKWGAWIRRPWPQT